MVRLVKIGEAARLLGVSQVTLRRWEKKGKLLPEPYEAGETRYYDVKKLLDIQTEESDLTYGYARVSSHDQKQDLRTQVELLSSYCAAKGWSYEILEDLGSGMNYRKKGLKKLLDAILHQRIKRLVITHKDRLLRFGSELIFALCEAKHIEVVMINQGEPASPYAKASGDKSLYAKASRGRPKL